MSSCARFAMHARTRAACRCWLNYGHTVAAATVAPIAVCSMLAIIMVEAAGMDARDMLDGAEPRQRRAAWYDERLLSRRASESLVIP